jgi:hypothetical protein
MSVALAPLVLVSPDAADSPVVPVPEALAAELTPAVTTAVEALLARQPAPALDLEALELALRRRALEVAARCLERFLNTPAGPDLRPTAACPDCKKKPVASGSAPRRSKRRSGH